MSLSGCSVEEVQEMFEYGNPALRQELNQNWFGVTNEETRDTNSPYANNRDYTFGNYDLKEVEESKLADLPEYDLSGPDAEDQPSLGENQDASLLSTQDSTELSSETLSQTSGKTIYLVPICCGNAYDGYVARSRTGYDNLMKNATAQTIDGYKDALKTLKKPIDQKLYGQNRYVGKKNTKLLAGNVSQDYSEWKACWDACLRIGTQLKKDGADVMYAYNKTSYTNKASNPETFFGNRSNFTVQDIAEDIAAKKPDYVIFVGFNENDFGIGTDTHRSKGTTFLYHKYDGIKNGAFAKALAKSYGNVTDLNESIPLNGSSKAYREAKDYQKIDPKYCIGAQKAESFLMAMEINGVEAKSAAMLLGYYNTNVGNSKAKYSYNKQSVLYAKIAQVIENAI